MAGNDDPRPFAWTKTADEILNFLEKYLLAKLRRRKLGGVYHVEIAPGTCSDIACDTTENSHWPLDETIANDDQVGGDALFKLHQRLSRLSFFGSRVNSGSGYFLLKTLTHRVN